MKEPRRAIVFDIQRFCVHDGPGIRTVVFFKGCPLACEWCQNPEAMLAAPELSYAEERCLTDCTLCLQTCPELAIRPRRSGRIDFALCTACGTCVDACPSGALQQVGRSVHVDALLEEVLRDRSFFEASGGGVTLSGGEPILHSAFLAEFLPRAREQRLHIAVETCGAWPYSRIEALLPHLDLVLFDLKTATAARHEQLTRRDNRQIVSNLERLLASPLAVEVRMPVVPGRNAGADDVAEIASLLNDLGVGSLTLLPYNHLWEAKLPRLGASRVPLGILPPPDGFYRQLQSEFSRHGVAARM